MARTFHSFIKNKVSEVSRRRQFKNLYYYQHGLVSVIPRKPWYQLLYIPTDFCKQLSFIVIKSTLFMVMSYYHIRCALYMIRG